MAAEPFQITRYANPADIPANLFAQFGEGVIVEDATNGWLVMGTAAHGNVTFKPTGSVVTTVNGARGVRTDTGIAESGAATLWKDEPVNAQTGTSYAIQDADRGGLTTFNNSAAVAVTIGQAGTSGAFANGWCADYTNLGAGTVTITPTTSTINGAATYTLTTGQSVRIVSDGTNYQVTAIGKAAGGSGTVTSVGISGPSIIIWSGTPITTSGTMTGTLATQNANTVFAGPSSGSAAAPTFRALVGADIPASLLTGYVYGLGLVYASSSTLLVNPGVCRDNSDTTFLSLSTQQTISDGAIGALGDDEFAGPGTITTTGSSSVVTGTSTTFLTSFGTRALTGTVTTSGTAVTGSGTLFLSQLAVGDLIGNASKGYSRVTAIASNTSATITATIPGGNLSAASCNAIENPTLLISSVLVVSTITSNTSLTVIGTPAAHSGITYHIGSIGGGGSATQVFSYVWIGNGGSGTTAFISTQRTTPFGVSGYNTYVRRIGTVLIDSSGNIVPFMQSGGGSQRSVAYDLAAITDNNRLLSAGTSTTFADVVASALAPPAATKIRFNAQLIGGAVGHSMYMRTRNSGGGSPASTPLFINALSTTVGAANVIETECDGAQGLQYKVSANTDAAYMDCFGYVEQL